jgi:hypothetical protein
MEEECYDLQGRGLNLIEEEAEQARGFFDSISISAAWKS